MCDDKLYYSKEMSWSPGKEKTLLESSRNSSCKEIYQLLVLEECSGTKCLYYITKGVSCYERTLMYHVKRAM